MLHWRPWEPLDPDNWTCTTGLGRCPCRAAETETSPLPLASSPVGGALSAAAAWTLPAGATPHSQLEEKNNTFHHRDIKTDVSCLKTRVLGCFFTSFSTHPPERGPGCSSEEWWWSSGWGFPARPPVICLSSQGSVCGSSAPLVWRDT